MTLEEREKMIKEIGQEFKEANELIAGSFYPVTESLKKKVFAIIRTKIKL